MVKRSTLIMIAVLATAMITTSYSAVSQHRYPLRSSEKRTGAVYVFTDTYSCFTANISLGTFAHWAREKNIPMVVFLCGVDSARGREYAARELRGVGRFVFDELGAHLGLFDVKELPRLLVLHRDGKELYRGTPGKVSFDVEAYQQALETISADPFVEERYLLKGISRPKDQEEIFPLDSAGQIGTAAGTSMRYDVATGRHILFNHSTRNVTTLGAGGKIVNHQKFTFRNPCYTPATPMLIGLSVGGDTLIFCDTDLSSARVYLARYSPQGAYVDTIPLPIENERISYRADFSAPSDLLMMGRRISDGYSPFIADTGLLYARSPGTHTWSTVGHYRPHFYDTLAAQWAWCGMAAVGDQVATYQNFDSVIQIHSIDNRLVATIPVDLPEDLLASVIPAVSNSNDSLLIERMDTPYARRLRAHNLHYDDQTGKLYLSLIARREQIVGAPSQQFGRSYQTVLLEFDVEKRSQTAIVQLPLNTIIHAVCNGALMGVTEREDKLFLYRLAATAIR